MGFFTYIFLCLYITHITVGQTFQYSRGWTNGKRGIVLVPLKNPAPSLKQQTFLPCLLDSQSVTSDREAKNIRSKLFDHELMLDADDTQRSIKDEDGY